MHEDIGLRWYGRVSIITDLASGLALALVLQTGLRLPSLGIGVGEILLAVCTLLGLVIAAGLWRREGWIAWHHLLCWSILFIVVYMLAGLLPLTLHHTSSGFPGSSMRDWAAYAFCAVFLCSVALRPTNFRVLSGALAVALISFWVGSLFLWSDSTWYYEQRFRGWALNPNQVALYVLCSLVLLLANVRSAFFIIVAVSGLVVFGYLSKSDALLAAFAVYAAASAFVALVPYGKLRQRTPWMLVAMVMFYLLFREGLHGIVASLWTAADNDNARILLYSHGLDAWLSSWQSFLFGFGAGSYSGLDSPFQGAEAHNTVIDTLTVGGFSMLVAVYLFPLAGLVLAYRKGRLWVFGALSALIAFTFFHYVARQPAYWLASYGTLVGLIFSLSERAIQTRGVCSPRRSDSVPDQQGTDKGHSGMPVV